MEIQKRILNDITDFIFVSDEPRRADVIFLPGDSSPRTPEHAAELYRSGYAPLIIPSGKYSVKKGCFSGPKSGKERYSGDYKTECEFYTDVLVKNGVPADAIIGENMAEYTRANAYLTASIAKRRGLRFEKAIIVCKSFHARRCLMLYQTAFPETELIVCPVDAAGIARDNWYKTKKGIYRVLGELAKCGNQFDDDMERYILELLAVERG